MRRLLVLFVVVIFTVPLFLYSCNKGEEIKLDFDLTVPDNWVAYVYANEGYVYDARRIQVNEQDTLVEALIVYKNHVPGYNLPYYYANLKGEIQRSAAYDSLIYDTDTTINGTSFKKMLSAEFFRYVNKVYLDTFLVDVVTTRYFFYANDYGYNMTFVSVDSLQSANRIVFDNIMSTFHYQE
jgi:hypothetical protein